MPWQGRSDAAPSQGLARISVQAGVQGSWRKGNMQVDHRSHLLSVGCDGGWLLSKTSKERKRLFMTFYCKSTHMDFCRQDSIVPRTVGKYINCSVLWFSLTTAEGSEKQLFLTLKSFFLWSGTRDTLQWATIMAEFVHSSMNIGQPSSYHFCVTGHCGWINSMGIIT